jgi:hypothetical protein
MSVVVDTWYGCRVTEDSDQTVIFPLLRPKCGKTLSQAFRKRERENESTVEE